MASTLERLRLDGKVAVVTGASKNIGLAISQAFAEAGATVVMTARTQSLLEVAADGIRRSTNATVHAMAADVGDSGSTDALAAWVGAEFDQVDILVNNAAMLGPAVGSRMLDHEAGDALGIDDDVWESVYAVNLFGAYRLCAAFGNKMRAGRGGSIVNVLSGAGFQALPGAGSAMPYGSSKAALWMMTRYLAAELAPAIRVNAVCPGTTKEDGGVAQEGDRQSVLVSRTPMGRVANPAEIAPAVLYLASDASPYTTGAVITVNGGRAW